MIPLPRGSWGWLVLGLVLLVPILGLWKWRGIGVQPTGTPAVRSFPAPFARPGGTVPTPGSSPVGIPTTAGQPSSTPTVPGAPRTPGAAGNQSSLPAARETDSTQAVPGILPTPASVSGIPARTEGPMPGSGHGSSANEPGSGPRSAVALSTHPAAGSPATDASKYNPAERDPTLSLADLEKLEELNRPRLPVVSGQKPKPRHQVRIEDQIHLDGIIASEDSINAIVNGDRVREHDVVSGARIRKITQTCVEFEYKKKTFSKCIKK